MSKLSQTAVLAVVRQLTSEGHHDISSSEVSDRANISVATARRHLDALCKQGKLDRIGMTRSTRYRLTQSDDVSSVTRLPSPQKADETQGDATAASGVTGIVWSQASIDLRSKLQVPLTQRTHVTYQRAFVDAYIPNHSCLLPSHLAEKLSRAGGLKDRLPAGTYARKVLEQLLVDLSWSSSRLEGNRYSLLETKALFEGAKVATDTDAIMLLNHKSAIEFLTDAVPEEGLTRSVVTNIHTLLMSDLLADDNGLGAIRKKVVNITGTVYIPTQAPALLEEMFQVIIDKVCAIRNPVEAAFFLWVNLAYLQPFEDGNKRTTRLSANIPLLIYNCAPLAFLDVDLNEYTEAMLGVYEFQDVSIAVDVFAWTYGRSIEKYQVVVEAMSAPNPQRLAYRQSMQEAIGHIVRDRMSIDDAVDAVGLTEENAPGFKSMLESELASLGEHNYARYRITRSMFQKWTEANKPK